MFVIIWKDQTAFGPFNSIEEARQWIEDTFGASAEMLQMRVHAVESPGPTKGEEK